MLEIKLIPVREFERIRSSSIEESAKMALIADLCRANTFMVVKKAGSGHLGSSFSAMDIVVYLYYKEMNTIALGLDHQDRDIYFSSKGHDVPGFYSVLYSLSILSQEKILNLRRLGGLDGHPDVKIPGVEANSGSLGMGISKARGMAIAKHLKGNKGRIFVLTGDGELQEGQIWESLQTTVHQKINNINVIVDYNKIQSDKPVKEINNLGNLERKFEAFGWHVERCDGHDYAALDIIFKKFRGITDKPKILIADTIKGKGISFMEGQTALTNGNGLYKWHSGAPDDDSFEVGHKEILDSINDRLDKLKIKQISLEGIETREKGRGRLKDVAEKVVSAYGDALVELGKKRKDIVVLDADLSADCGLRPFENTFPERFIENGIAEQDMVSIAGGLALHGFLPIVNSFGVFLASRANEQIYNNATEGTKIIYVCHYAGLIPAGPGKSHQSLRDISLFGALPNCIVLQPCNADETRLMVEYCVNQATENCAIRLAIGPSPRKIQLPPDYRLEPGHGVALSQGNDAILFAYGPVMLHEAMRASELLAERNFGLKVVNLPWLNRVDVKWLTETITRFEMLYVLEDHAPVGGLADHLLDVLASGAKHRTHRRLIKFAVEGFPACGTPQEALHYHQLDAASLADRILRATDGP
jgi:transketolase